MGEEKKVHDRDALLIKYIRKLSCKSPLILNLLERIESIDKEEGPADFFNSIEAIADQSGLNLADRYLETLDMECLFKLENQIMPDVFAMISTVTSKGETNG